jgi:hypothetical protein
LFPFFLLLVLRCLAVLFRNLPFVQQLLSTLNTLFLWLHPTDLDKQGL